MLRKNTVVFGVLVVLLGLALWAVFPLGGERLGRQGLRLGLDLVGGVHLVYEAQFPEGATPEERAGNMDRAVDTIQRRIDKYGVTDPIIQRLGTDRILVQLPGFTDIDAAKSLVEQTGFLEFRRVEVKDNGQPVRLSDYRAQDKLAFIEGGETGNRVFVDERGNPAAFLVEGPEGPQFVDEEGKPVDAAGLSGEALSWVAARGSGGAQLTGEFLEEAAPSIRTMPTGAEAEVSIRWNSEGARNFDEIAARLFDAGAYGTPQRALGIFLDNNLLSSPQILERSYRGSAVITGNFSIEDVNRMANLLQSGALPMPLKKPPLFQEKVSATLGANFAEMSATAGIIGLILIMLFMIAYYRLSGVLASLALIFYAVLVLALFKMIPVTLTLAGIGGFVLSVGMAVDANILIFERMKEELRSGRTLGAAVEAGFDRAWSAIRDSNMTTFIVCIILYWLGSSIVASAPVMSFALTLFIGVAVSMFTALTVTRTLLRMTISTGLARHKSLMSVSGGRENV
ncbi:MAG: protein translocase subunit SecD [Chloroflexi bacterium]|nr:protein translocase subunit SecD [Chloroflexota bacterium]